MLVLTRKEGLGIVIQKPGFQPIVITISKLHRGSVRLGIEAPKEAIVMRGELIDGATRQSQEPREPRGQTRRHTGSAGAATKASRKDGLPQDVRKI